MKKEVIETNEPLQPTGGRILVAQVSRFLSRPRRLNWGIRGLGNCMRIANEYYLIVDLEATCSNEGAVPRHEMEIRRRKGTGLNGINLSPSCFTPQAFAEHMAWLCHTVILFGSAFDDAWFEGRKGTRGAEGDTGGRGHCTQRLMPWAFTEEGVPHAPFFRNCLVRVSHFFWAWIARDLCGEVRAVFFDTTARHPLPLIIARF